MIISNPQTLQVLLAGAVTTNQLPIATAWANMLDDGSTFAPDNTLALTNNTAAVDVVAAPAASNKRQLKYLSIVNSDTVDATVIVRVNNAGVFTNLARVLLPANYRLEYTFTAGLRIFDENGAVLGLGTPGTNGTNGAGVPVGGTAGQVLSKIDGTDFNTQWSTGGGSGSGTPDFIIQSYGVT